MICKTLSPLIVGSDANINQSPCLILELATIVISKCLTKLSPTLEVYQ